MEVASPIRMNNCNVLQLSVVDSDTEGDCDTEFDRDSGWGLSAHGWLGEVVVDGDVVLVPVVVDDSDKLADDEKDRVAVAVVLRVGEADRLTDGDCDEVVVVLSVGALDELVEAVLEMVAVRVLVRLIEGVKDGDVESVGTVVGELVVVMDTDCE